MNEFDGNMRGNSADRTQIRQVNEVDLQLQLDFPKVSQDFMCSMHYITSGHGWNMWFAAHPTSGKSDHHQRGKWNFAGSWASTLVSCIKMGTLERERGQAPGKGPKMGQYPLMI